MAYKLSLEAAGDLQEVFFYGFTTWGGERASSFIRKLYSRFEWLSLNPELTPLRDDINPPGVYRSWYEKPYVIFYQMTKEGIGIVTVIHERRDIRKHFS
jgi:toxin ParE1/3/4